MKFKKYLIERTMNFDTALKVFGISAQDVADKSKLKSLYRKLAMQHHPDRGGTKEMAQDVNDAYAVLSKSKVSGSSSKVDWDEIDRKYRALGAAIKNELLSNFKPEIFQNYFNEMSGLKFNYEIKRAFPLEKDRSPHFAGFEVEFFTNDKSTVFSLYISANLVDVLRDREAAILGIDDISYNVTTVATGFHNNRKQKMSKSDWGWTRDHSFFRKPEQIFPKKKLKDIFSGKTRKKGGFKKRDMELFLKNKLGARLEYPSNQTQAAIPIGENEDGMEYNLIIYRTVFNRVGGWSGIGIYLKKGKYGYGSRVEDTGHWTLPETEETAKIFEKVQKESLKAKGDNKPKTAKKLLKRAYEDFKKAKGWD
jgi:curved DNA-binding protein CbpA